MCTFYTEKGAYFTHRSVHIVNGERYTFCREKWAYFARRKVLILCTEKGACFSRRRRNILLLRFMPIVHGEVGSIMHGASVLYYTRRSGPVLRRRNAHILLGEGGLIFYLNGKRPHFTRRRGAYCTRRRMLILHRRKRASFYAEMGAYIVRRRGLNCKRISFHNLQGIGGLFCLEKGPILHGEWGLFLCA